MSRPSGPTRIGLAAGLVVTLALTLAGVAVAGSTRTPAVPAPTAAEPSITNPSIALVLIDDFSMELLPRMRGLHDLAFDADGDLRDGVAIYRNSFVVDSLCCPSRAALFDGQYPFLTEVRTNKGSNGGFSAWQRSGGPDRSFNTRLPVAYHTGFMGKYMNGYNIDDRDTPGYQDDSSPAAPGWDTFEAVSAKGYQEWGYRVSYLDHTTTPATVRWHPPEKVPKALERRDAVYATNRLADLAADFVDERRAADEPYFLEVAPYGTHSRVGGKAYPEDPAFPAAFEDRTPQGCGSDCDELTVDDLKGYDDRNTVADNRPYLDNGQGIRKATSWRALCGTVCPWKPGVARPKLRDRARMAQSIDRLITSLRAKMGPDSYLFVTADNGYHLGQHGLAGGKGTPYDSDIRVPMMVLGPADDVEAGYRAQVVSNVDLAPTFEQLTGATVPDYHSGRSFASSLGDADAEGRRVAVIDHTWASDKGADVDKDAAISIIPSYVAVRSDRGLLVRFTRSPRWRPGPGSAKFAWELYGFPSGPAPAFERTNIYRREFSRPDGQRPGWVRILSATLDDYLECRREHDDGQGDECVGSGVG